MKLGFRSFISDLLSKPRQNTQSANINGNNNSVEQKIYVSVDAGDSVNREWLTQAIPSPTPKTQIYDNLAAEEKSDQDEIKRIIEYRRIADEGDAETALKLLHNLQTDKRYSAGHVAFRLNFNIGIIQVNIGELEAASVSLRKAYTYATENKKAEAGLALADLNDGQNNEALERAKGLIEHEGDHQNLAVVIAFHAAANLGVEFDITNYSIQEPDNQDVVSAGLEYTRIVHPDIYSKALDDTFRSHPTNGSVALMWARAVLDDVQQNQAFLLGAKSSDAFDEQLSKSAEILRDDLDSALKHRPPNKLLLPSQAHNAAIALRLAGNVAGAAKLLDKVLEDYPTIAAELAQIRGVLFLQEDRDHDAFLLIEPFHEIPELQVMASEIEAKMGRYTEALKRINEALKKSMPDGLRTTALLTKARIAINSSNRAAADEAVEELTANSPSSLELILIQSAYSRAFDLLMERDEVEQIPIVEKEKTEADRNLLNSLSKADEWDFSTILQAADELLARGYYRECAHLLRNRVSFSKESPALHTLCEACVRGGLGTLAKEILKNLAPDVKNSVFGWKFIANVSYLHGEISKAVPVTRKLFENNNRSISALEWYVQSLLRLNKKNRICRVVSELNDDELVGTIGEKREYVNLLVYCGEISRARSYAYQLFCENRNDHRAWMALSSSVLAFGEPPETTDDLHLLEVGTDAAFEVLRADGKSETYIIEEDKQLFPLRDENITLDHPISKAAMGKKEGETFIWPFDKKDETVKINIIKHKTLDAFHHILRRFEVQFPDAAGFKSVTIETNQDGGLDEMKALLQQRAEYAQQKSKEYKDGSYPLPILGFHLGIDPIDAFLGLWRECNVSPKVSSCSHVDQDNADSALKKARDSGIIADAVACYLLRRLEIEKCTEDEFGRIGVTQTTIDIFAQRLQEAEHSSFVEAEDGTRRTSTIAVHDGNLIMSETTEDEVNSKIELLRSDLYWLEHECTLLPTVAKTDPSDEVIRFRNQNGGRFLDDIFAADGSDRLLLSDDFHLRQWASGLFGVQAAWIQALLFHLEEAGRIDTKMVVRCTIHLIGLGEETLSLNAHRLVTATLMLSTGELNDSEFDQYCALLGQPGAEMRSHIPVAVSAISEIWSRRTLIQYREKATSIILRKLIRNQSENYKEILDIIGRLVRNPNLIEYIRGWRKGHFLV
jgi:tetratricopeptide (TPR) repeat protein